MKLFFKSIIVLFILYQKPCFGQENNSNIESKPYYINFNSSDKVVHSIDNENIDIQYRDLTGDSKNLTLNIYNWEGSKENAGYSLTKKYGINYYTININDVFAGWEAEDIYRFTIEDNNKVKSTILIKKVDPDITDLPIVNIVSNPLNVDCDIPDVTVIDFYGAITGGKAPYEVAWMVYNEASTDLLYTPKYDVVSDGNETSIIRVDKDPNYNVFILIKDACGNEVEQNVFINCKKTDEKVNSIFIESLTTNPKTEQ